MFQQSEQSAYLKRIGYAEQPIPSLTALHSLHAHHLRSVPYENIDIVLNRPLHLSPDALFEKIVAQQRGGFCYELNIAFAGLLESVGFQVELLSAHLWKDEAWGPEYDHLILAVRCNEDDGIWLADVGNARWFQRPIPLRDGTLYKEFGITYRLRLNDGVYLFTKQELSGEEVAQYRFTTQPRRAEDFVAMCRFKETAAESWFRQNLVYAQRTPNGSVILSNTQCSVLSNGTREDFPVQSFDDFVKQFQHYWHTTPPLELADFFMQEQQLKTVL